MIKTLEYFLEDSFSIKCTKMCRKRVKVWSQFRLFMVKIIIITFIYIKLCAEYIKLRVKFWWK